MRTRIQQAVSDATFLFLLADSLPPGPMKNQARERGERLVSFIFDISMGVTQESLSAPLDADET